MVGRLNWMSRHRNCQPLFISKLAHCPGFCLATAPVRLPMFWVASLPYVHVSLATPCTSRAVTSTLLGTWRTCWSKVSPLAYLLVAGPTQAMGAFSHSANHYVVYPGNTPENHPPAEGCMINSKQHRGCRIRDPGTRGKHQTKKKSLVYQQGGGRVQNSGPWDPWLPVVENSQLFAQRTVRTQYPRGQLWRLGGGGFDTHVEGSSCWWLDLECVQAGCLRFSGGFSVRLARSLHSGAAVNVLGAVLSNTENEPCLTSSESPAQMPLHAKRLHMLAYRVWGGCQGTISTGIISEGENFSHLQES